MKNTLFVLILILFAFLAAQIVDGRGKYLIPGLMDMHTHLLSDGDDYPDSIAEDELRVMVANAASTLEFDCAEIKNK